MERSPIDIQEKILSFEHFLNETLRQDLRQVLEKRDRLYGEIAEYLQLKTTIERIQESNLEKEELKTKVDLGCNFYVQASVPDCSRIFVCVGFGIYLEFTLKEAIKFSEKKVKRFTVLTDKLTEDASKIKAHIKLVLEGLKELQGIDDREGTPFRDVLS
ncbi:protein UXT homolog [Liolophura sinensis]|uniref:protein UXT homolog n=1 Tax=Liolophura sinensis TaxID=3198878 RepID=UPI00315945E8